MSKHLAQMGVLTHRFVHAWPSARPPINTSGIFLAHMFNSSSCNCAVLMRAPGAYAHKKNKNKKAPEGAKGVHSGPARGRICPKSKFPY
jgi:hypothetical protein